MSRQHTLTAEQQQQQGQQGVAHPFVIRICPFESYFFIAVLLNTEVKLHREDGASLHGIFIGTTGT